MAPAMPRSARRRTRHVEKLITRAAVDRSAINWPSVGTRTFRAVSVWLNACAGGAATIRAELAPLYRQELRIGGCPARNPDVLHHPFVRLVAHAPAFIGRDRQAPARRSVSWSRRLPWPVESSLGQQVRAIHVRVAVSRYGSSSWSSLAVILRCFGEPAIAWSRPRGQEIFHVHQ